MDNIRRRIENILNSNSNEIEVVDKLRKELENYDKETYTYNNEGILTEEIQSSESKDILEEVEISDIENLSNQDISSLDRTDMLIEETQSSEGKVILEEFESLDIEILKNEEMLSLDTENILTEEHQSSECKDMVEEPEPSDNEILINEEIPSSYRESILDEEELSSEDKESMVNVNNGSGIELFKKQIEEDKENHRRAIEKFEEWKIRIKNICSKSEETFNKVNDIVENFIHKINFTLEEVSDEEKKIIQNRIKGINMINKMSKNAMSNDLKKLSEMHDKSLEEINIITDVSIANEEDISYIINDNYNVITNIENEISKLIRKIFDFIEGSLLPIVDGIESGKNFVENSNKEILEQDILPVYVELKSCFEDLLISCNIKKIEIKKGDVIDFTYTEILEVQEVNDENLDETVESIIRDGYEYLEDIYSVGRNYLIRQVQIVANKYKE